MSRTNAAVGPSKAPAPPKLHALYSFPRRHDIPASALPSKQPAAIGPDPHAEPLDELGAVIPTEDAARMLGVSIKRLISERGRYRRGIAHEVTATGELRWSVPSIEDFVAATFAPAQVLKLSGEVVPTDDAARMLCVQAKRLMDRDGRYRRSIGHQALPNGRFVWSLADIRRFLAAEVH